MRENRNALADIMQGAEACEQFGRRFVAPFGQNRTATETCAPGLASDSILIRSFARSFS